jgi:putative transposase
VRGRQRPIGVDSLGLLRAVVVPAAAVHDARVACALCHRRLWDEMPRRERVSPDSHDSAAYLDEEVFDIAPFERVVMSRPPDSEGFVKLPQRGVVERTFAWLSRSRRLRKDYAFLTESSAAMIQTSRIHRMLRRLRPTRRKRSPRFRYKRL